MHRWSSLQLVYESLLPSLLLVFSLRRVSYMKYVDFSPEAKYNDYFLFSLVRPNSKDHAYSCWNRHTSHTHHAFLTATGVVDPSSYGYLNILVWYCCVFVAMQRKLKDNFFRSHPPNLKHVCDSVSER